MGFVTYIEAKYIISKAQKTAEVKWKHIAVRFLLYVNWCNDILKVLQQSKVAYYKTWKKWRLKK